MRLRSVSGFVALFCLGACTNQTTAWPRGGLNLHAAADAKSAATCPCQIKRELTQKLQELADLISNEGPKKDLYQALRNAAAKKDVLFGDLEDDDKFIAAPGVAIQVTFFNQTRAYLNSFLKKEILGKRDAGKDYLVDLTKPETQRMAQAILHRLAGPRYLSFLREWQVSTAVISSKDKNGKTNQTIKFIRPLLLEFSEINLAEITVYLKALLGQKYAPVYASQKLGQAAQTQVAQHLAQQISILQQDYLQNPQSGFTKYAADGWTTAAQAKLAGLVERYTQKKASLKFKQHQKVLLAKAVFTPDLGKAEADLASWQEALWAYTAILSAALHDIL